MPRYCNQSWLEALALEGKQNVARRRHRISCTVRVQEAAKVQARSDEITRRMQDLQQQLARSHAAPTAPHTAQAALLPAAAVTSAARGRSRAVPERCGALPARAAAGTSPQRHGATAAALRSDAHSGRDAPHSAAPEAISQQGHMQPGASKSPTRSAAAAPEPPTASPSHRSVKAVGSQHDQSTSKAKLVCAPASKQGGPAALAAGPKGLALPAVNPHMPAAVQRLAQRNAPQKEETSALKPGLALKSNTALVAPAHKLPAAQAGVSSTPALQRKAAANVLQGRSVDSTAHPAVTAGRHAASNDAALSPSRQAQHILARASTAAQRQTAATSAACIERVDSATMEQHLLGLAMLGIDVNLPSTEQATHKKDARAGVLS